MSFYQHFLYVTDPSQRHLPNGASQNNGYHVPPMIIPPRNKENNTLRLGADKEGGKAYGTNMRHYVDEKSKGRGSNVHITCECKVNKWEKN
jgi:hypothetical protein